MIKPNWDIFKAKFSENPQLNFEWFCYLLFCREFNMPKGIDRYKNQAGIEMQPIEYDGKYIGVQAKFYNKTLNSYKNDFIKMLDTIKHKYPNVNTLYLYSNQEWGQGRGDEKSKVELEVNQKANSLGINIEWRLKSYFESEFVVLENKLLSEYFFSLVDTENIFEKVNIINKKYSREFSPLESGYINRKEEIICKENIEAGKSFILHGKAGRGKSGITINLINYLIQENIPYLAIKLDKNTPDKNADIWSKELGLPCNIAECLDYISRDTKGVLILDQLDALRWTKANSKTALDVCYEIINKIELINTNRENKISIVFVCRTYDLVNDNSIKSIFEKYNNSENLVWNKIQVDELSEEETANVIGDDFWKLNNKTRNVLRILSNLYIWQQIKDSISLDEVNNCFTTAKLIEKWWEDIKNKGNRLNFDMTELEQCKNELVTRFEKSTKTEISKRRISISSEIMDFLISHNFIVNNNDKISFSHQSILDYLFAQKMESEYINGLTVEEIIGKNQTPVRRFQLQLLMQMLLEENTEEFIDFGEKLIYSNLIRVSFKFVFYEILNDITSTDENINEFILNNCENQAIIKNVLLNNSIWIILLMKKGVLDEWVKDDSKIDYVTVMLYNLSKKYNDDKAEFLIRNIDIMLEKNIKMDLIFGNDITEDSNDLFEFRMKVYNQNHKIISDFYFDINQIFIKNYKRAVVLLKFLLQNDINVKELDLIKCKDIFSINNNIYDCEYIVSEIINIIPNNTEVNYWELYKWSSSRNIYENFERSVIEMLKICSKNLVEHNPNVFIKTFKNYFGKGSLLHNEIILFCLQYATEEYSDKIISYICSDFNKNVFDYTSSTNNRLCYVKEIIRTHSKSCSLECFNKLEHLIYYYKSPTMYENAKRIYEYNKNHWENLLWGYHGNFQYELLSELDPNRVSKKTSEFIKVLNRKFTQNYFYKKEKSQGVFGTSSPVKSKKLSDKAWLKILSSNKILIDGNSRHFENNSTDNSLYQFGRDFKECVIKEPARFIKLFLENYQKVREDFIYYLVLGLSLVDDFTDIEFNDLECLIQICIVPYSEKIFSGILGIISKNTSENWSSNIVSMLIDTALKNTDEFEGYEYTTNNDKYINYIQTRSINHVKSDSIYCIAKLLSKHNELFEKSKSIVTKNIADSDVAIKYSVFELLRMIYKIDEEYSISNMIMMFKDDILITGAFYADNVILCLVEEYDLKSVILDMYASEHTELREIGIRLITMLYLKYNYFDDIIKNPKNIEHEDNRTIIYVAIENLNNYKYNEKCKEILLLYQNKKFDMEFSRLFYDKKIDIKRDKDFICSLNQTGEKTLAGLKEYLIENALSVLDFSEIIISMCEKNILNNQAIYYRNDMSVLLFMLYDEANGKKQYVEIAKKCLDFIDLMFQHNIVDLKKLSKEIMDR